MVKRLFNPILPHGPTVERALRDVHTSHLPIDSPAPWYSTVSAWLPTLQGALTVSRLFQA